MNDRHDTRTPLRAQSLSPALFGPGLLILYAFLGQRMTPSVAIPLPLRADLVAMALLGTAALLGTDGLYPTDAILPGLRVKERRRALLAVGGALLGATVVAPWVAVPWLVVSALAFLWASRKGGGKGRPRGVGPAVVFLWACVNLVALSVTTAWGLRVPPDDFAARDFRVNTLLADVPLHDAWVIDLRGGEPPTLDEVSRAFRRSSPIQSTPALLGLGALRGMLGHALGWDDPRWADEEASFVSRVTDADRRRSTTAPGTPLGGWSLVYAFPEEGVVELINGTVHVAVSCTIGEGTSGTSLYLSFRVREVNWSTPFYMGLIDPFRRYLVYPPLIRQFAHTLGRDG